MSIQAMTWAWGLEALDTSQAMVLLALADAANDDGFACWPSQETLARKSRMSVRSVKRHIATLRDAGLIDVETQSSTRGRRANLYRLHVGAEVDLSAVSRQRAKLAPSNSTGEEKVDIPPKGQNDPLRNEGTNEAPKGTPMTPTKGTPMTPCNIRTVIKNHQTEPTREEAPVAHEVESFGSVGSGADAEVDSPLGEADAELIAQCLPPFMRAMDADGAVAVTRTLRDCLDAGWQPDQIREVMNQALPPDVGRLSGLVSYRLHKNVLKGKSPVRSADEDAGVRREREREALRLRQRRSEALAGQGEGVDVDPLWEQAWNQTVSENPQASRVEQLRLAQARHAVLLGGESA